MTDGYEIKSFKSHFDKGRYLPNLILLNEDLSPNDRERTLLHELRHHNFFSKYPFLKPFLYRWKFLAPYYFLAISTLLVAPLIYAIMVLPLLVLSLQEMDVSMSRDTWSSGSLVRSVLQIFWLLYPISMLVVSYL